MALFQLKTILLDTGERLPLLIERATGIPLFEPTVFTVSQLRARNLATNTIIQAMRAIVVLHTMLAKNDIDLNRRLDEGKILSQGEIDELVGMAKKELASFTDLGKEEDRRDQPRKVLSLEQARLSLTRNQAPNEVNSDTTAIRLLYIREYLNWRIDERLLRTTTSHKHRATLAELKVIVDEAISQRTPISRGRCHQEERLGLDGDERALLLEITDLQHPDNPWSSSHAKERNALIVRLGLGLGLRRGELLGLRIQDISALHEEVFVARRPDDKTDPRLDQPNAKTRERTIVLTSSLAEQIRTYVQGLRREQGDARKHPFLLVASGTGKPLSISGFNKIFRPLQQASPQLRHVISHLLRHTFNDDMSDELEAAGESGPAVWKSLLRLNGWSETSQMPARYTKRSTARKANAAHRTLQEKLIGKEQS